MKTMPKIILLGCAEGIAQSLELLVRDHKVEIVAVVPMTDKSGRFLRSSALVEAARAHGIKVLRVLNVNSPAFIGTVRKGKIDLLCNWGHGQLFSPALIASARIGALNLHPGLLPYGRGSGAVQGEMLNRARRIGQTCHLMDEKFDRGVIVCQRSFPVKGDEYLGELEAKLKRNAGAFFVKGIYTGLTGRRLKKITRFGRYYPKLADGDTIIDWNQPSDLIVRKVRSRSPSLLSRVFVCADNREFFVRKIAPSAVADYRFVPGQVIDKDPRRGVLVKTGDNAVWIEEISFDQKAFFIPRFKIGTCFLANPLVETVRLRQVIDDLTSRIEKLEKS